MVNNDVWVAACGGTETPFKTRTGATLHYMWNQVTGEHAYYHVEADKFVDGDDLNILMGLVEVAPIWEEG